MKLFILSFVLLFLCIEIVHSDSGNAFALTPEEMVFASKLSDANRHRFCYEFSFSQRRICMQEKTKGLFSPDRIVENMTAWQESEPIPLGDQSRTDNSG